MFDIKKLNNLLVFENTKLEYTKIGPAGFYWIWTDKNDSIEAKLLITAKESYWNFEILTVKNQNNGFLKRLSYVLGNFALDSGVKDFYIKTPFSESKEAFRRIGFMDGESWYMTAKVSDVADYGNWVIEGGNKPSWRDKFD